MNTFFWPFTLSFTYNLYHTARHALLSKGMPLRPLMVIVLQEEAMIQQGGNGNERV